MIDMKRPKVYEAVLQEENTATIRIAPLERGFGITVGNALRRVLLSSLPGTAAVGIKIEGIDHELETKEGVIEDIIDIVLNVKAIRFRTDSTQPDFKRVLTLEHSKKGTVFANDIQLSSDVEIVNPTQPICTLSEDTTIRMEITIEQGRGYRKAEDNRKINTEMGYIPIDSLFTPVISAKYEVKPARQNDQLNYDDLLMTVTTDGSMSPVEVVALSAKILETHMGFITSLDEKIADREIIQEEEVVEEKKIDIKIDELELTVRSYNCLKRAGIHTLDDLLKRTEQEMSNVRNLGKKSLDEIKTKIGELGYSFKETSDN